MSEQKSGFVPTSKQTLDSINVICIKCGITVSDYHDGIGADKKGVITIVKRLIVILFIKFNIGRLTVKGIVAPKSTNKFAVDYLYGTAVKQFKKDVKFNSDVRELAKALSAIFGCDPVDKALITWPTSKTKDIDREPSNIAPATSEVEKKGVKSGLQTPPIENFILFIFKKSGGTAAEIARKCGITTDQVHIAFSQVDEYLGDVNITEAMEIFKKLLNTKR